MNMHPSLHFMCGKAGSGKSTLAKAIAEQHGAALLCEDVWLARLFPAELVTFEDYIRYSRRIKAVVAPLVIDLLKRQSVVLDFPANTIDTRSWFRSIFESANTPHTLHFLDASNALCLSQIAKRNIERPEGSHELSEEAFHHITSFFQQPTKDEGFNIRVHSQIESP
jgi:predicted kinase